MLFVEYMGPSHIKIQLPLQFSTQLILGKQISEKSFCKYDKIKFDIVKNEAPFCLKNKTVQGVQHFI